MTGRLGALGGLGTNISGYWTFATCLCLWFLVVHSPPLIIERRMYQNIPLATHLAGYVRSGREVVATSLRRWQMNLRHVVEVSHHADFLRAYTVYLACMINSLMTPSTKYGKSWHSTVGRVGMVSGFASFGLGFYCTWLSGADVDPGFQIGITIGGISQVVCQAFGWRAIRRYKLKCSQIDDLGKGDTTGQDEAFDELRAKLQGEKEAALTNHVKGMIALYAVACGTPAMIRLVDIVLPNAGVLGLVGALVGLNMVVEPFANTYLQTGGHAVRANPAGPQKASHAETYGTYEPPETHNC